MSIDVEDVALDLDVAVPCGLVINELLTNALKHAFPEGRSGGVHVSLRREAGGMLALAVADNGIGLPPTVDIGNPATLGLRIVRILAVQIRGTLEARSDGGGTTITLVFPSPGSRVRD